MILYYDKDGVPIDAATLNQLLSDWAYNHNFGDAPPLIFETMVFGEGALDLDCRRYATEAQARAGHVEMVTTVATTLDDPVVMDVTEDTATQPSSEDNP